MPARIAESVKALRGTARPGRRIAPAALVRLTRAPAAPANLSPAAAAEWQRLAPILVRAGTLTDGDLVALQLLAETLGSANEFAATVAREGTTIPAGGGSKGHPALQALATARAQARTLLSDFGLSPRSRASVDVAAEPPQPDRPRTGLDYFRNPR